MSAYSAAATPGRIGPIGNIDRRSRRLWRPYQSGFRFPRGAPSPQGGLGHQSRRRFWARRSVGFPEPPGRREPSGRRGGAAGKPRLVASSGRFLPAAPSASVCNWFRLFALKAKALRVRWNGGAGRSVAPSSGATAALALSVSLNRLDAYDAAAKKAAACASPAPGGANSCIIPCIMERSNSGSTSSAQAECKTSKGE